MYVRSGRLGFEVRLSSGGPRFGERCTASLLGLKTRKLWKLLCACINGIRRVIMFVFVTFWGVT